MVKVCERLTNSIKKNSLAAVIADDCWSRWSEKPELPAAHHIQLAATDPRFCDTCSSTRMGNCGQTLRLWSCWWDSYPNWQNLIYTAQTCEQGTAALCWLPNFQVPSLYKSQVARSVAVEICLAIMHENVWKIRAHILIFFIVENILPLF